MAEQTGWSPWPYKKPGTDEMDRDIIFASRVHSRLIGAHEASIANAFACGISIPHYLAGGDYYDLLPLANGNLRVVVADVMGKGFGASMLMTMLRGGVRTASRQTHSTGGLLSVMNDLFFADLQKLGSFITLCCLDYDPGTRACTVACAGHPAPLLLRSTAAEPEIMKVRGVALGMLSNRQYTEVTATLAPGDLLLLYSDGIVEAKDSHGQDLATAGLVRILTDHRSLPLPDLLKRILADIAAHTGGGGPRDDVTLAALRLGDWQP